MRDPFLLFSTAGLWPTEKTPSRFSTFNLSVVGWRVTDITLPEERRLCCVILLFSTPLSHRNMPQFNSIRALGVRMVDHDAQQIGGLDRAGSLHPGGTGAGIGTSGPDMSRRVVSLRA